MPDYLKRVGRDTTDDTIIRTSEAEKTLSRVRGPASKRLGIDRGSIPSVAAPLEGQMMVQYDDESVGTTPVAPEVGSTFKGESPYYFANQKWRPFAFGGLDPDYGYYDTVGVTVGVSSSGLDSWHYHSGAALLDLTDPTNPAFIGRGAYAVTGTASFDGGWTSGAFPQGTFIFVPDGVSWTTDFWFQSQVDPGDGFPPNVSFAGTFQSEIGGVVQLKFWNFDPSSSRDFSATQIRVQRIFSF